MRWRPGDLRHTSDADEGCSLPGLTWFTGASCTGPDRHLTPQEPTGCGADLERNGVSRLPGSYPGGTTTAVRQQAATREGCESGRIGTLGKRVKGNLPWVRIPPPPP